MSSDNILIVEDDKEFLSDLSARIEKLGYRAFAIYYPQDFVKYKTVIHKYHITLCILDLWVQEREHDRIGTGSDPHVAFEILHDMEGLGIPTLVFTDHPNYGQPATDWLKDYSAYPLPKSNTLRVSSFLEQEFEKFLQSKVAEAKWLMAAEGYDEQGEWTGNSRAPY